VSANIAWLISNHVAVFRWTTAVCVEYAVLRQLSTTNRCVASLMTEHTPPSKASAFALSAAILHTDDSAHPDSEAFVKRERHRLSRELKTVYELESPEPSSHKQLPPSAPRTIPASSIRSCRSSGRSSLRAGNTSSPSSHLSQATTAEDSQGPEAQGSGRYRLRRQVPHWYDPVVKFWTSQVSVTIDEGSYRDHLGTSPVPYQAASLTLPSP
jgi:hypothetical protein